MKVTVMRTTNQKKDQDFKKDEFYLHVESIAKKYSIFSFPLIKFRPWQENALDIGLKFTNDLQKLYVESIPERKTRNYHLFYYWYQIRKTNGILIEIFPKNLLVRFISFQTYAERDYADEQFSYLVLVFTVEEVLELFVLVKAKPKKFPEFAKYPELITFIESTIKVITTSLPEANRRPIVQFDFSLLNQLNAAYIGWKSKEKSHGVAFNAFTIFDNFQYYTTNEFPQFTVVDEYMLEIYDRQCGLTYYSASFIEEFPFIDERFGGISFWAILWKGIIERKSVIEYNIYFLPFLAQFDGMWEIWAQVFNNRSEEEWESFQKTQMDFIYSNKWKSNVVLSLQFWFTLMNFISGTNPMLRAGKDDNYYAIGSCVSCPYPISFKFTDFARDLLKVKEFQFDPVFILNALRFDNKYCFWQELWCYLFHDDSLESMTERYPDQPPYGLQVFTDKHQTNWTNHHDFFLDHLYTLSNEQIFKLHYLEEIIPFLELQGNAIAMSTSVLSLVLFKFVLIYLKKTKPDHNPVISATLNLTKHTSHFDLSASKPASFIVFHIDQASQFSVKLPDYEEAQCYFFELLGSSLSSINFTCTKTTEINPPNLYQSMSFWRAVLLDWSLNPLSWKDYPFIAATKVKPLWMEWIKMTNNETMQHLSEEIYYKRKHLPIEFLWHIAGASSTECSKSPTFSEEDVDDDFSIECKLFGNAKSIHVPRKFLDKLLCSVKETDLAFRIYQQITHEKFPYYALVIKNTKLNSENPFFMKVMLRHPLYIQTWNNFNGSPLKGEVLDKLYRFIHDKAGCTDHFALPYYLLWMFLSWNHQSSGEKPSLQVTVTSVSSPGNSNSIQINFDQISIKEDSLSDAILQFNKYEENTIFTLGESNGSKVKEHKQFAKELCHLQLDEELHEFTSLLKTYNCALKQELMKKKIFWKVLQIIDLEDLITMFGTNHSPSAMITNLFRKGCRDYTTGYGNEMDVVVFTVHYLDLDFLLTLIPKCSSGFLVKVIIPVFFSIFKSTPLLLLNHESTFPILITEKEKLLFEQIEDLPKVLQIQILLIPVLSKLEQFLNMILIRSEEKDYSSKIYGDVKDRLLNHYVTIRRLLFKYDDPANRLDQVHRLMSSSYNTSLTEFPHVTNLYYTHYHPFIPKSPKQTLSHQTFSYVKLISLTPKDKTKTLVNTFFSNLTSKRSFKEEGYQIKVSISTIPSLCTFFLGFFPSIPDFHPFLIQTLDYNRNSRYITGKDILQFMYYSQYQWTAILSHPDYRSPYRLSDEKGPRESTAYYTSEFIEAISHFHPEKSFQKLLFHNSNVQSTVNQRVDESRFLLVLIMEEIIKVSLELSVWLYSSRDPEENLRSYKKPDLNEILSKYTMDDTSEFIFPWVFFIDLYFYQAFFYQFYRPTDNSSHSVTLNDHPNHRLINNGSPVAVGCYDPVRNPLGNLMSYLFEINYQRVYDRNLFFQEPVFDQKDPETYQPRRTQMLYPFWHNCMNIFFDKHFLSVFHVLPNRIRQVQLLSFISPQWIRSQNDSAIGVGDERYGFIVFNESYIEMKTHRSYLLQLLYQYLTEKYGRSAAFYSEEDRQNWKNFIQTSVQKVFLSGDYQKPSYHFDDFSGSDDSDDMSDDDNESEGLDDSHSSTDQSHPTIRDDESDESDEFDGSESDGVEENESNNDSSENSNGSDDPSNSKDSQESDESDDFDDNSESSNDHDDNNQDDSDEPDESVESEDDTYSIIYK